ncbi:MAG: S8 family serine peptidase [Bacteroidales bacterium]|nr:S8 family serine peptidase [Bacteroidales bacterium]
MKPFTIIVNNCKTVFFCRIFFIFCLTSFLFAVAYAQTPAKYWVAFTDKKGTPYSIAKPEAFLSPRAIELRKAHGIAIDERDLPVNPDYVRQVLALDTAARCFTTSKWLNGMTVYALREDMKEAIEKLPFVDSVQRTIAMKEPEPPIEPAYVFPENNGKPTFSYQSDIQKKNDFDYGKAAPQVRVNNVHWLHRMGFRGEGIQMMVLDGGFQNIDTIRCFEILRNDNRLLGARNFVQPEKDPMRKHTHGTMVLSCIASYIPGLLVGTAPMVQVYVAQTEDGRSENRIEEDNWVAGLEYADSLGCQVLNSSLGYTTFDDTVNQRTYADLTGEVSRASRAATIAASKGLLICNSAGNEGGKKWKYIGAPADARDILTVGAVNVKRNRAYFSSFGPTADGRIKPDACAVGRNTYLSTPTGIITIADGTSFSSPMLSGMVACLWQAFPEKSNYEIMEAIRQAGDRNVIFNGKVILQPDSNDGYGYGITDFLRAYNILKYGETDVYILYYTIDNPKINHTLRIFRENNSIPSNITITPIKFINGTMEECGKTTKIKSVGEAYNTTYGLVEHDIILPKLSKKHPYQLYRLDFVIDGKTVSRIVGQEWPLEEK